jgi:large subunit ribosomal protein L34e
MTAPRFRSRTFRRISKKLPGGEVVIHHEKRKPSQQKCAVCKVDLKGIPIVGVTKMRTLGISKKRPERPYGGYMCSKCTREKLKAISRQ